MRKRGKEQESCEKKSRKRDEKRRKRKGKEVGNKLNLLKVKNKEKWTKT